METIELHGISEESAEKKYEEMKKKYGKKYLVSLYHTACSDDYRIRFVKRPESDKK